MPQFNCISFFICVSFIPFLSISQSDKTIDSLNRALQTSRHDTSTINILNNLAWEYNTSDLDTTSFYATRALALAEKIDYKFGIATAFSNIGVINGLRANYSIALEHHKKALEIRKTIGDKKGAGASYDNISHAYESLGDYNEALEYSFNALKVREELSDKRGIADSYNGIGGIYATISDYKNAIEYLLKAVKIYEETGDHEGAAYGYNNIGAVYANQKNQEDALRYYSKSLNIFSDRGDRSGIAQLHNNIGNIYHEKKDFPNALQQYLRAVKIREETNDKRGMAQSYTNIGAIYSEAYENDTAKKIMFPVFDNSEIRTNIFRSALLDSAIQYQMKAYQIHKAIGAKQDMTYSLTGIGKILLNQNNPQDALKFFLEAKTIAEELQVKKELAFSIKGISDAYRAMGKYKEALEQYDLYKQWTDSVFDTEKSKQITEMQTKYETEKKDKSIEIQSLKISEQQLQLTQNKILQVFLFAGIIFIIILALLLYNRNKIKQRELLKTHLLEEEKMHTKAIIETQEQERTRIARDLHDGIGQTMAGIIANYEQIGNDIILLSEEKQNIFRHTAKSLDGAYRELRAISHQMMPRALKAVGLSAAISDLLDNTLLNTSINYSFEKQDIVDIPESIAIGIYRIFQELLGNILKHSQANKISIQLFKNQNQIILIVEDDGVGISLSLLGKEGEGLKSGIGLTNITARAQAMQGTFLIEPATTNGTIATVIVPLQIPTDER